MEVHGSDSNFLTTQMQAHFIPSGTRSEEECPEELRLHRASFFALHREGTKAHAVWPSGQDRSLRTDS